MINILKKYTIIILGLLLFFNNNANCQYDRTYYVIDKYTGPQKTVTYSFDAQTNTGQGALDDILLQIFNYLHNSGHVDPINIGIIFNVPLSDPNDETSGLVHIESVLMPINPGASKITLDGGSLQNNQGLYNDESVFSVDQFFMLQGNSVEIKNLHFIHYGNDEIIYSQECKEIIFKNNIVHGDNKGTAFTIQKPEKMTVNGNKFYNYTTHIYINTYTIPNDIAISNNYFINESEINSRGIYFNYLSFLDAPYNTVKISKNHFYNSTNILIYKVNKGFSITDNIFNFTTVGIDASAIVLPSQTEILSFVNPNDLGYDTCNVGNKFYAAEPGDFSILLLTTYETDLKQARIINYKLPGGIKIYRASNIVIRGCEIDANAETPIGLALAANGSIKAPLINKVILMPDDEISIKYELPDLSSGNGPFVVDIYRSNSDGDLLELIHSEYITVLDPNEEYESTFLNNDVEIFSMTVTSLGEPDDFSNGIGTSKASKFAPVLNISSPGDVCRGVSFDITVEGGSVYQYSFDGGTWATCSLPTISKTFETAGEHIFCARVLGTTASQCLTITAHDCNPGPYSTCENCIEPFAPIAGNRYIVGAWVKEENGQTAYTYTKASLKITCYEEILEEISNETPLQTFELFASGKIIDGWQKIEDDITIPQYTRTLVVELVNNGATGDVFFDDIRFHPFNSAMKTYVYDVVTGKLNAVNDENNYATFYEYDEEGALVRVKKETERGIMTIQESRNTTKKP